jgi:hypothetical protein
MIARAVVVYAGDLMESSISSRTRMIPITMMGKLAVLASSYQRELAQSDGDEKKRKMQNSLQKRLLEEGVLQSVALWKTTKGTP